MLHGYTCCGSYPFYREPWGVSPQKFEKRALAIFRLEPDPYESVHQLDCSLLFPTAMANGTERYNNFLLSDPTNKQQTPAASDRQHGF